MPAPSLLALVAFVALVALSSGPLHVNALVADRAQVARHVHAHDAIAKRKRSDSSAPSSSGRCNPRPSSSLVSSPLPTPTSTPTSTTPPPAPSTTSAAPSPTSTGATKKGCIAWGADDSVLPNFASLSQVSLLYNWGPVAPSNLDGLAFMPMLWGTNQVSQFQQTVVEGYATFAAGPNEPNEPSQSNILPQDAASLWMTYLEPLKDLGYTLVSPACTDDDSGLQWYQDFFGNCTQCTIDKIAFHAYTTNATYLASYATTLHNTYNLPVWITEFADQNYSGEGGQPTMDEVWDFAGQVVSFAQSTSWLEMACPFGVMNDLQGVDTNNALLNSDGTPTALAYYYFDTPGF